MKHISLNKDGCQEFLTFLKTIEHGLGNKVKTIRLKTIRSWLVVGYFRPFLINIVINPNKCNIAFEKRFFKNYRTQFCQ